MDSVRAPPPICHQAPGAAAGRHLCVAAGCHGCRWGLRRGAMVAARASRYGQGRHGYCVRPSRAAPTNLTERTRRRPSKRPYHQPPFASSPCSTWSPPAALSPQPHLYPCWTPSEHRRPPKLGSLHHRRSSLTWREKGERRERGRKKKGFYSLTRESHASGEKKGKRGKGICCSTSP